MVHEAERLEQVEVAGSPGLLCEGEHTVTYRTTGAARSRSGPGWREDLLWQRGDLTSRLESPLPKEEAIRIAETVR